MPHGLGANRKCDDGTIDGELTVTIRQNAFVRTTNQRSRDGTGLDDWALLRQQRQRYDYNDDAAMRRKKMFFRLILTTTQHNEDAGMRDQDLHRQRRQQRTEGLAVAGLEKGDLIVFRKTVCVALRKAFCFVLRKTVCFALRKAFCSF